MDMEELSDRLEGIEISIDAVFEKLHAISDDSDRQKYVIFVQKTLDKFEDCMKNVDKLNTMINEFKGCVAMARGAMVANKKPD